jgi:hypothetical protein
MATGLYEKLRLVGLSLVHAASQSDLAAVAKWAAKATALAAPHVTARFAVAVTTTVVDPTYFQPSEEWWTYVFGHGLNISHVRPTLLPGTKVLTPAGLAAARALGIEFGPR